MIPCRPWWRRRRDRPARTSFSPTTILRKDAVRTLPRVPATLWPLTSIPASDPVLWPERLHAAALLSESALPSGAAVAEIPHGMESRAPVPHAVRFVRAEALFSGGDPGAAAALFRE